MINVSHELTAAETKIYQSALALALLAYHEEGGRQVEVDVLHRLLREVHSAARTFQEQMRRDGLPPRPTVMVRR